jgi:hypothetical protein
VYNDVVERPDVLHVLERIRLAARAAQVRQTGRPPDIRKQQVVDLALAFCARYSPSLPSSDPNKFFTAFAERFYEATTGSSVEKPGAGIGRQIKKALKRLPIERERARLLDETPRR